MEASTVRYGQSDLPFASVTGKYLVVVERTFPLKAEEQRIYWKPRSTSSKLGLTHLGIGAKTNAGYGRMTLILSAKQSVCRRGW